jgi:hypothetical protein
LGDNALENDGIRDPGFKNQGIVEIDGFDPGNAKRNEAIMKIHQQVQKWYSDYDDRCGDEPSALGVTTR